MEMTREKEAAQAGVEAAAEGLVAVSHELWEQPELAFEEFHSAEVCSDALDRAGFDVTGAVVGGLETSFVAEHGTGDLVVGICAEYDALPDIGHACGHNMIAASAIGAGVGLAKCGGRPRDHRARLRHPGRGGRRRQDPHGRAGRLRRRAPRDDGAPQPVRERRLPHAREQRSAATGSTARTRTRRSHRTSGVNAADAVTIAQVAMGLLRQHLEPGDQIHGIVTRGGEAPNVVPALAEAKYVMRAHRPSRRSRTARAEGPSVLRGRSVTRRAPRSRSSRSPTVGTASSSTTTTLALAYRANAEGDRSGLPATGARAPPGRPTWRTCR